MSKDEEIAELKAAIKAVDGWLQALEGVGLTYYLCHDEETAATIKRVLAE